MSASKSSLTALTLGAIGVVYGDIGTSVLYAVKEVFGSGHVPFTPDNVYGILSIFFWTLTVIVSLKYVVLVLRADNNGEGGLVAMLALASQSVKDKPRLRRVLLVVGIFGTCLFYGDGASRSGDVPNPVSVPGNASQTMWFRGQKSFDSAIDLLLSLGMSQAELIVFTGGSAGGLTVFLHLDHVAARMKTEAPNARVVGEPVCGYFLDAGNDGS